MPTKRARQILTYLYLTLLMGLVFVGVWRSQFAEDESQWIYTTRYLTLFSKGMFDSPEWDTYWTRTQPPLARYVMGASLKAGGYNLLELNGPWDFTKEPTENAELGNMPSPEMLFWARLPMGIISALSVLLIFGIGSRIAGTAAGLGAATWLALNIRTRDLMTRAEADGLLIFLMLVGLLLAVMLVKKLSESGASRRQAIFLLTIALGLAIGLGMASKLTAVIGLVALPLSLGAVLLYRRVRAGSVTGRNILEALGITAGAALLAAILFVALNPALYDAPLTGTFDMFHFRQVEMEEQMSTYPSGALEAGWPRLAAGLQRPLFTYSVGVSMAMRLGGSEARSIGEVLPFDALLVALGLAVTIWSIATAIKRKATTRKSGSDSESTDRNEAAIVALVWTLLFFVSIVANMGLDWDRYTLPLMVFAALWAGVGIGWLAGLIQKAMTRQTTAT